MNGPGRSPNAEVRGVTCCVLRVPLVACVRRNTQHATRPTSEFGLRASLLVSLLSFCLLLVPAAAFAHGELHLAILALTKQIAAATNNPARLYLDRGDLHRLHANWPAAAADYSRAAELDPTLATVDVSRARLLADSGQLDAALTMFGKAIARSPRDGEAFIGRARVLVKLGRRKPAITDYRHGLGLLEKPAPECYLECAQQQAAEGQQAAALRCLDLGVERLGPLVKLQSYAFELELARQHLDSALARLDTIIANASRPETWLAKRGDLLLALGKPALARQSFRAALQAINKLPLLLQRAPHTEKLKATATAALAEIRDAPAVLTATP